MKRLPIQRIELGMEELESILQRARTSPLDEPDCAKIRAVFETYLYLTELLENKAITIDRLRKLLFGPSSEKTRDVVPPTPTAPAAAVPDGAESPPAAVPDGAESAPAAAEATPSKRRGHGRNGADEYEGAAKIAVPHESLKSGDPCPDCTKGKVYEVATPGVLVRIVGQAPVQATVYELQKLRCNLCGKVFTAQLPQGVGSEKYDETAGSMIALLKYGSGMPFYRLEGLQENLGMPLPASTQWNIVSEAAAIVAPAYEELVRQAAQGEVVYNDDTTMKILELMGKRAKAKALAEAEDAPERAKDASKRTGIFTSGIVSTKAGRTIALFFTGRKHAGENLAEVLAHRAAALGPPIQMCDALTRNVPGELKTILGNCLAHGRRQFVDVAGRFPEECRHLLETLRDVYKNDEVAKERNLSPEERRSFHQVESGPLMDDLKVWLLRQFEDRLVEPNSPLGEAISYMLNHWEKLTLFLRQPGAPLDNNLCERVLKRAILHRKNAMFYKTENGAHAGDLFMSLIHTCRLGGVDPFDYLTVLQRHALELAAAPAKWMPWNYQEMLALAGTTAP